MDWWHVALDIRPSSGSSSTHTTPASSSKSPGNELFSKDLAAAAAKASTGKSKTGSSTATQAAPAKQPSQGKSASTASSDPNAAPNRADSAPTQGSGAGNSATHQQPSAAAAAAGNPATDDFANEAVTVTAGSQAAANATLKGRPAAKGAAAKGLSSASIATTARAAEPADGPNAGASNAPGMSLLQLLAQSLQGDDSTTTATDPAPVKSAESTDEDVPNAQANATALAQFTQALAAALGASSTGMQAVTSNAAPCGSNAATDNVIDVAKGSSPAQELLSQWVQVVAADVKSQSDTTAAQSVATAAKSSDTDNTATNSATAATNPLAHLGVASHFSVQHTPGTASAEEIQSPVGSAAWSDELGGHLTWMTQNGLETGSLRVSPEHLGPIEVQISVQNGTASVWFGANHPDTRAALEQTLPRLREMFAGQGMTLTDSGVSRESPRNQTKTPAPQGISAVSAAGSAEVSVSAAVRASLGLVDTYA
jgi:flagellar hook-length control protein FliK